MVESSLSRISNRDFGIFSACVREDISAMHGFSVADDK
jgi:hypothetical protein